MKVAIVGFATEGKSSLAYWTAQRHDITICDQDPTLAIPGAYASQLGDTYLDNLDSFDCIVRSAGIHPRLILSKNPGVEDKITTQIQEFFSVCPSRNIIGVTGTKGKGTTSTLIAKMLESAGKTVHLGGNIGTAALELLPHIQPDDYVVLELSSFQLADFKGPGPRVGVCLMVVPEHLNWHADLDEYLAAKSHLFLAQPQDSTAIYNALSPASQQIAGNSPGTKIAYEVPLIRENPQHTEAAYVLGEDIYYQHTRICGVADVALVGRHNLENVCAAISSVWNEIKGDTAAITKVLQSFTGLEHRLEFVRKVQDVAYYDDSFATTPETAIAAIRSFPQPKVLILGGSDKGIPLDSLADEVAAQGDGVRSVILIGDMAPALEDLLKTRGVHTLQKGPTTMTEIIAAVQAAAQPGDVVLLSTGCASFGLFKDYKDRGNQFKQAVLALA